MAHRLGVFFLLFFSHYLLAQDASTAIDARLSDSIDIEQVYIIADVPVMKSLPLPIIQIKQRELQRDAGLNVLSSINRVAGVYVHSGALNTTRITIRGIGNRSLFSTAKLRAYLNDIPLTNGIGETTIEDIDLSIIDHVNVYKGPSSSIYGAGLGGVIQLNTHHNHNSISNQISSGLSVGSFGLFRYTQSIQLSNKEQTASVSVRYHNTHSDGYRDNNEYDREGINIVGVLRADNKNTTTLIANYSTLNAFIPSSLNINDFTDNPTAAAANWAAVRGFENDDKILLGINHKIDIATLFTDYILSNSSSIYTNYRNAYESRPFNILDETSTSIGFRTNVNIDKLNKLAAPDKKISLQGATAGIEYYNENYQWQTFITDGGNLGNALSNNQEIRSYLNVFLQTRLKIGDRIEAISGLNINQTEYDYEDRFTNDNIDLSGEFSFDFVVSPGLGASYRLSNGNYIYANIGHGFSPPTLEETLTPDGNINPDIRPERGWNFEIGSRGNISKSISYDISAYHMRIQDLLVARRVAEDQFVGINAGRTDHNGIEATVNYQILTKKHKLSLFSSYALSDHTFIDFVDGEDDFSGNALTGTARHHLNGGLDYNSSFGLYGNMTYKYLSSFPIRDDNSIFSDAYQVLDFKFGYRKLINEKLQLDIHFGIQNILDERYASMILINASSFGGALPRYFYPGLPRNTYSGVSLKYYL
jgi:iron complex outermembrane receptor protein